VFWALKYCSAQRWGWSQNPTALQNFIKELTKFHFCTCTVEMSDTKGEVDKMSS